MKRGYIAVLLITRIIFVRALQQKFTFRQVRSSDFNLVFPAASRPNVSELSGIGHVLQDSFSEYTLSERYNPVTIGANLFLTHAEWNDGFQSGGDKNLTRLQFYTITSFLVRNDEDLPSRFTIDNDIIQVFSLPSSKKLFVSIVRSSGLSAFHKIEDVTLFFAPVADQDDDSDIAKPSQTSSSLSPIDLFIVVMSILILFGTAFIIYRCKREQFQFEESQDEPGIVKLFKTESQTISQNEEGGDKRGTKPDVENGGGSVPEPPTPVISNVSKRNKDISLDDQEDLSTLQSPAFKSKSVSAIHPKFQAEHSYHATKFSMVDSHSWPGSNSYGLTIPNGLTLSSILKTSFSVMPHAGTPSNSFSHGLSLSESGSGSVEEKSETSSIAFASSNEIPEPESHLSTDASASSVETNGTVDGSNISLNSDSTDIEMFDENWFKARMASQSCEDDDGTCDVFQVSTEASKTDLANSKPSSGEWFKKIHVVCDQSNKTMRTSATSMANSSNEQTESPQGSLSSCDDSLEQSFASSVANY